MTLLMCNAQKKSDHCLNQCLHGKPHEHEKERDGNCKNPSYCTLSKSKSIIKVKCKILNKRQLKELRNES